MKARVLFITILFVVVLTTGCLSFFSSSKRNVLIYNFDQKEYLWSNNEQDCKILSQKIFITKWSVYDNNSKINNVSIQDKLFSTRILDGEEPCLIYISSAAGQVSVKQFYFISPVLGGNFFIENGFLYLIPERLTDVHGNEYYPCLIEDEGKLRKNVSEFILKNKDLVIKYQPAYGGHGSKEKFPLNLSK